MLDTSERILRDLGYAIISRYFIEEPSSLKSEENYIEF